MASEVASPDISGSSAADTDIPNRLTGNVYSSWALAKPVTAPVGNRLGKHCIDIGTDLHDTSTDEHGHKIAHDFAHMHKHGVHTAAQMWRDPPDHRYLYRAIAARCRAPIPTPA